ncbi:MAG: glycosyltransferase family 4 protein [Balneolaceae bacterium]|nr:glycosyltransferase family 4 protein [Balneolaceae bacterium]
MLSNDYPPVTGGVSTHIKCLSENLAKQEVAVHLLVPTPGLSSPLDTQIVNNVTIHRTGYQDSSFLPLRAFRITKRTLIAYSKLKDQGLSFDLLHQQDVRATKMAASLISKKDGVPLVWTCHSPHMWSKSKWLNHLFLDMINYQHSGIIAVSHQLQSMAQHNWGDQITALEYIPNSVDFERFHPAAKSLEKLPPRLENDDFILFCPSRQVDIKGTPYLAEAMKQIFESRTDTDIKIIF